MPKTAFVDGDIATKSPGTRLLAAFLNKIFNHRHDGLDVDGSAPLDFAADTSEAPNALVAALTPALTAPVVGMPILIAVNNTNTGSVTLDLNGLGPVLIKKLGGLALSSGDIQVNQIVSVAYDGEFYQLLSYNSPQSTNASTLQGQSAAMLCPPGAKGEFFMPTVPEGWLPCDGRAVLRAQYPELYAAIGTTWGAGDNVSTFNLPEVRGEYFRAWDNERGVDPDRAFASFQAGGNKSHNHVATADAQGAHSHTGTTEAAGTHNHSIPAQSNSSGSFPYVEDADATGAAVAVNTGDAGNHQHNFNTSAVAAHAHNITVAADGIAETRVRNIAVLVCIKY